jgi:hypothetical protein
MYGEENKNWSFHAFLALLPANKDLLVQKLLIIPHVQRLNTTDT